MKLFIDDANLDAIRELIEYYPIDGVTTNPSILAKAGKNPWQTLREIREVIGEDRILFAQATAQTAEGMVKDGRLIVNELGKNTVVKVPSNKEGYKAISILAGEGICVCGTVVYSPMQAYFAAAAGATYVAPYVNRLDNLGYNGVGVVKEIQDILTGQKLNCEVLAASFKNTQQVIDLAKIGVGAITAGADIIKAMDSNAAVVHAVEDFDKDFERLTGVHAMAEIL